MREKIVTKLKEIEIFLDKRIDRTDCMEVKKTRNFKRVISNNFFMLKIIAEASPWMIPFLLFLSMVRGVNSFFIITYLYSFTLKKYGFKLIWFECIFSFLFDAVVYAGAIIFAAYKSLVKLNLPIGDCFVVINSITNLWKINHKLQMEKKLL